MPTSYETPVSVTRQAGHARSHLLLTLAHMGVPWAVFLALTIMGNVLYIAVGKLVDHGHWTDLTTGMVLAFGLALAAYDWHLRRHRMSVAGKYIGPAIAASATAMTAAFLQAGYSAPLVLLWMFGGAAGSIAWDGWLHHAEHHDLVVGFTARAEKSGMGAAFFVPSKKAKGAAKKPASRSRLAGRVHLRDMTPDQAAARAAELESAHRWPPGAVSLVPNPDDGSVADFAQTDPGALTAPLPWPGPSAPGATMAAPFRMGGRQDEVPFLVSMVPVRHTRTTGMTGSGKTMSHLYNRAAEGITRSNYALFGVDLTKFWQYLGPMRPALHGAAVDPAGALRLMAGLERVRQARMGWMAARNITEWTDGCGLNYLDVALEELGDILALLKDAAKGQAGTPFDIGSWLTNIRAGRSAGMSWNVSLQSGGYKTFPTEARGSFYPFTFGLVDSNDVAPALSERQSKAGCRPTLWQDRQPGMAYADHPGMEENTYSVPARFFDWGQTGELMAAYAASYPASGRPLDEVSAEALAAEPPGAEAQPSYGLPGPGGTLPGAVPACRARGGRGDSTVVAGPWKGAAPAAHQQDTAAVAAEKALWKLLLKMYAEGTEVVGAHEIMVRPEFKATVNRARSWIYTALDGLANTGRTQALTGGARRQWRITPPPAKSGQEQA